jgi:hypothetical protein
MNEPMRIAIESIPKNPDSCIAILSACLVPLVAIVTTYIAWQQFRISRNKLKLDLYDKRYDFYSKLYSLIEEIHIKAEMPMTALVEFRKNYSLGTFLFDSKIRVVIEQVYTKSFRHEQIKDKLYRNDGTMKEFKSENEMNALVNEKVEILDWFLKLDFVNLQNLFRKYFLLSNK